MIKVVPSKCWRNSKTGETASLYGAAPWFGGGEHPDWSVVQVGWTWEHPNGTVGLGRMPAKTREEAQEVADRLNAKFYNNR